MFVQLLNRFSTFVSRVTSCSPDSLLWTAAGLIWFIRNSLFFRSQNHTSLTAQWSYEAKYRDEINFKKGDVVTFIRKDANNKDWLVVKTRHATIGRVPGTYFRLTKTLTINNGESTDSCNKNNKCKTGDIKGKGAKSLQRIDTRTRIMQEIIQTERVSIHSSKPHFIWNLTLVILENALLIRIQHFHERKCPPSAIQQKACDIGG